MKQTLIALPGFLGVPTDWTDIFPEAIVHAFDEVLPLGLWADNFNAWASSLPAPRLLAGYSMGGRLALHALVSRPDLWEGALIISAHTGLTTQTAKTDRLHEDQKWAARFLNDEWALLMDDWNQRGALRTSAPLDRTEISYSRSHLASMLHHWSLGQQEDLRIAIQNLNLPILWLAGGNDLPFREIAQSLQFKNQQSRAMIIEGAGHRILHEHPQFIRKEWPWKQ